MFKKLLSLSIALVMLSTVAFIAPETSFIEEKASAAEVEETFGHTDLELLRIQETVTDGVKSQAIKAFNFVDNQYINPSTTTTGYWYLAKINVGKNWNFSSLSLQLRWGMQRGYYHTGFGAPLSKADFDAAKEALANNTTLSTLVNPLENSDSRQTVFRGSDGAGNLWNGSNNSAQSRTINFDASDFTEENYVDGYLYVAFQAFLKTTENGTDYVGYPRLNFSSSSGAASVLVTVKGTKGEAIVVDDFSDSEITWNNGAYTVETATKSGTAMLIAASFNGTTMLDAKVATIDAEDAVDGVISGNITGLIRGTTVKLFLWDSATLKPCIAPRVIPVKTEFQEQFSGKKIIFIGNSHTFYGRTVKASYSNKLSSRSNDTGGFYQLCKQNGIDMSVTNWTFSGHGLSGIFGGEPCYTHNNCQGVIHLDELTDRYYDYVVIQPGVASNYTGLTNQIDEISALFKKENPNVKVILLGNASVYGINASDTVYPDTTQQYKGLSEKGYLIADWGYLVKNIIEGTETVPGATQTYNKKTFIVKDNYHPNMLSGYITTLFTYCTITGAKAEGQPFMYFWNANTAPQDVAEYVESYYNNGDADTTFPEILRSESDIRGIQKLVDQYIADKPYLEY